MIKFNIILSSLTIFLLSFSTAYSYEIFRVEVKGSVKYDNASMPTDVIINNDGTYQVYDSFLGKLVTYNGSKKVKELTSREIRNGVAAYHSKGRYYFAVPESNEIKILDSFLNMSSKITAPDDKKFDPTDLISANGKVYIVDNDNHRVLVLNEKTLKLERSVGGKGSDIDKFRFPFSIAVDNERFLFVSDVLNARISVISTAYKIVQSIGKFGVDEGELYRPTGVAIYKGKYLLVTDGYLGVVQVFSNIGKPLGVLGDTKNSVKHYGSPTRVRTLGEFVAVIDAYDRVVEIFTISDLP